MQDRTPTSNQSPAVDHEQLRERIVEDLLRLGVGKWDIRKSETRYLVQLIHPDERIGGVLYGRSSEGSILIVATNKRVLYVDTKPFFKKAEDVSYESIMGVTWEWVVFRGTLILERSVGNFVVHTTHRQVAETFRSYVELRCIEHNKQN